MKIKDVVVEDFTNYKEPSMFIITPKCNFKCCKEAGVDICQNMDIVKQADIDIDVHDLVRMYRKNKITKAVVFGGLEPMDTFDDMYEFIKVLRLGISCHDPVIVYTGYTEEECEDKIKLLQRWDNIIVKFGRFIPNCEEHFDEVLGINLASGNQYAKKIS